MRTLEQVLADWYEQAAVLKRRGHPLDAQLIADVLSDVREGAEDYLTWLSEPAALMRSGWPLRRLRARFPEWEAQGHARRAGKERQYRQLAVPKRANAEAAYEQGREAGRKSA